MQLTPKWMKGMWCTYRKPHNLGCLILYSYMFHHWLTTFYILHPYKRLLFGQTVHNIVNFWISQNFIVAVMSIYSNPNWLVVILLWLYSPLLDLGRFFSFLILYIVGRTPWTGDQSVARPYLNTGQHTQKRIHTPNIHALSGIRTYDPSVRVSEDSSCLRQRGYCDRYLTYVLCNFSD
jgi:hypothetical protein